MIKIRPEAVESEEDAAFADAAEQEVTFLLLPMKTYRLCSERAKIDGCTPAQVFEKALLQYLRPGKDEMRDSPTKTELPEESRPEPDVVIRRRR